MTRQRYYQLDVGEKSAELYIYGDITSWPWLESDVSSYNLSQELAALGPVEEIDVRINSYGGEVAEGLAIYNALRGHGARVKTVCDGFACSIASVIFMAGDDRVMNEASLLMIHNAWMATAGNSDELRKDADDLDTITDVSKGIYLALTDMDEETLTAWMDAETFVDSATALEHGFATEVVPVSGSKASQDARRIIARMLSVPHEQDAARSEGPHEAPAMDAVEQGEEPEELDDTPLRIAQAYMDMQSL